MMLAGLRYSRGRGETKAFPPPDPTFRVGDAELYKTRESKSCKKQGGREGTTKTRCLQAAGISASPKTLMNTNAVGLTDPHQPPSSCEEKIQISSAGFNHLLPLNNKPGGGEEMDLFMPLTVQQKKMFTALK